MKKITNNIILIVLLTMLSCASRVKTIKYTDKALKSYKTFAYLPNTLNELDGYGNTKDSSVEESLIAMLNTKMVEKGFSLNRNEPELLIILKTSKDLNSKTAEQNGLEKTPASINYTNNPNYATVNFEDYRRYYNLDADDIEDYPTKEGTLIIKVFDSQTEKILWTGIAENFKSHIADQTLMQRMLDGIFDEFPN